MEQIFHYTHNSCYKSISKHGLTYQNRNDAVYRYGTGAINNVLNKYKPKNITLNRDKCIFFYPNSKNLEEDEIEVRLGIDNINKKNIFAFNYNYAHLIWKEVIDAPYSGEYNNISLEETAAKYWNSILTYDQFIESKDKADSYELLYFDEIPSSIISIAKAKRTLITA